MKVEITEPIKMALRKSLDGRVSRLADFRPGEFHFVEFLGEGPDLETISFRFEDGYFALDVPRRSVAVRADD
jgi:hypothetical protein